MDKEIREKIRDGISAAARENDMTLSQAYERIEFLVRNGLNSPLPEVRAFWRRIPTEEKYPTIEEAVGYLTAVYMGLIN